MRGCPVAALRGPALDRPWGVWSSRQSSLRVEHGGHGVLRIHVAVCVEKDAEAFFLDLGRDLLIADVQPKPSGVTNVVPACAASKSIKADGIPSRNTVLHGLASPWQTTSAPPRRVDSAVTSCNARSRRAALMMASSENQPNSDGTVPEIYVSTSRPGSSIPRKRGAPVKPPRSRSTRTSCTNAALTPGVRCTVAPTLTTLVAVRPPDRCCIEMRVGSVSRRRGEYAERRVCSQAQSTAPSGAGTGASRCSALRTLASEELLRPVRGV